MSTSKSSDRVVVPGSRRYHRAAAQLLGAADPLEMIEVTVKVRRKAPLPEPVAGKPLSAEERLQKYGADPADFRRVEDELEKLGLTISRQSATARTLVVHGSVANMEAAFGVRLLEAKHEDHLYRARTGYVHVPRALAGIVTGVFGLDSRRMVRRRRPLRRGGGTGSIPQPSQRAWYLPQELASAYGFPSLDGEGQTVGLLEFGGHFSQKDLNEFARLARLPSTPPVEVKEVEKLSAANRRDPDATGEVMLDVEVVAGVCPKATINVYFSNWTEQGWIENLGAVLEDAERLSVVSVSYGLAEGTDIWTQQAMDEINDLLKELANAGIPVCASSGDDGSQDQVDDGAAHVDFPAASPYVLAVGGTALDRHSNQEVAWFDGDGLRSDGGGSTGGGVSRVFQRPSWQANVAIPNVDPGELDGRVVPDVAANAAGSTGYLMVAGGEVDVSGGTSAAAPLWASFLAGLKQAGRAVGYFTPVLYQAGPGGQPFGALVCKDVTLGGNATGKARGYKAHDGFDAVTGWGSPNGHALLELLAQGQADQHATATPRK